MEKVRPFFGLFRAFFQSSDDRLYKGWICSTREVENHVRFTGGFLKVGESSGFYHVNAKVAEKLSVFGRARCSCDLIFGVLRLEPD